MKAIKLKPNYAEVHYSMGVSLYDRGDLEAAVDSYKEAIKIRPKYAEAHNNMGNILTEKGDEYAALASYRKAVEIKSDYPDALFNLGHALSFKGDLDAAIDSFRQALKNKPDYAEAYNGLGLALKEKGDIDAAIKSYEQALKIQPDYVGACFNLGNLFWSKGQFKKAAELFKSDNSITGQLYFLRCLFAQNKQSDFYDQLEYLINRGCNNALIGSYISRSEVRFGIKKENPYCNYPLKYVYKISLTEMCDFKSIFIEGAKDILCDARVEHKPQSLLINGIQTAGNVFAQGGAIIDKMQAIIYSEIEKYKMHFKDSDEGLIMNWPGEYTIKGWLLSLKNGGAIRPHIHETGWLSGSIYINVPPKSKIDSGNLVVCTDDVELELDENKNSKSIDVITGSICLFPASLLHYTIPFEGEEDRIVLAFDVLPIS